MKPLSVGIVCFPSFGGSGVMATEIATGLSQRGHDVHLVATALPGRAQEKRLSFAFHRVEVPDYPLFEHAPYEAALSTRIFDLARERRLDLLHVHYAVPHAICGYVARQLLGPDAPRLVVSLHGTDVTGIGADPCYRSITAAAVSAADGVTVPSDYLRQQAYERLGVAPSTAIEVLHNFVDTERFHPPAARDVDTLHDLFGGGEGPVLFHVSNFRPVKRTGDLIEVLALVRQRLPARLVVVGDGPERGRVEQLAVERGVREHVAFLGKRGDFADALRHADAFVLPSESESFGVAALEALASGVPVFGYRVGGLPEVVAPGTGHLVEPFAVDALARSIVEVLSQPERRDALARAARTHACEHFRQGPAIERWERYFRRILAGAIG